MKAEKSGMEDKRKRNTQNNGDERENVRKGKVQRHLGEEESRRMTLRARRWTTKNKSGGKNNKEVYRRGVKKRAKGKVRVNDRQ